MSSYAFSRTIVNGLWAPSAGDLSAAIKESMSLDVIVRASDSDLTVDFDVLLTEEQESTLSGIVAELTGESRALSSAKEVKFFAIDCRTQELIARGFSFGGKVFSLSASAQRTLLSAYSIHDGLDMTYPIVWNTIDNEDSITIENPQDFKEFYLAAFDTCRAWLESGTTLKSAVRAAASFEELEAVIDTRG